MKAIFALILMCFTLIGCSGGGNSDPAAAGNSGPAVGNAISVFGVDGPMAGADVAIYDLQSYLDDPLTENNLLAQLETTDTQTALADDLELALNVGSGPFMVVISAKGTTIDLTTGRSPIIREVRTIVKSLSDARVYATPLTTAAVAIASKGQGNPMMF